MDLDVWVWIGRIGVLYSTVAAEETRVGGVDFCRILRRGCGTIYFCPKSCLDLVCGLGSGGEEKGGKVVRN